MCSRTQRPFVAFFVAARRCEKGGMYYETGGSEEERGGLPDK